MKIFIIKLIEYLKDFIKESKERWNAESPEYWKRILKFSIKLGTIAASIIAGDRFFDLQQYGVDPIIFTICGYILTACCALGLSAKITKKDGDNERTT